MPFVELAFRLTGSKVPVDHGYALYSAISRFVPEIHAAKDIGVHPIRGIYSGNGELSNQGWAGSDLSMLIVFPFPCVGVSGG